MTTTKMNVAISGYHNGQAVQPIVSATRKGSKVRVSLTWHDASDRTKCEAGSFVGTVRAAEDWLQAQGVRLDAQGIY